MLHDSNCFSYSLSVQYALGDLRFVPSSDDSDEDLSFEKPRGRGKGKQWTVLHSYGTAEEFKDNYPSRDDFLIRNKRITATNGLISNFQCKVKNCNYSLRCIEDKLIVEYSGEHMHLEEEELLHKRGLTKEQKEIVDRCISMKVRVVVLRKWYVVVSAMIIGGKYENGTLVERMVHSVVEMVQ